MKALQISVLILFVSTATLAQTPSMKTLFSPKGKSTTTVTGYGAVGTKYTRFADSPALLVGCYGGVLLNHRVLIGAGGYGLATNVYLPKEQLVKGDRARWEMNYYGLLLEYISRPQGVFHLNGTVLAGGGYVRKSLFDRDRDEWNLDDDGDGKPDLFYAVEPSLEVEVNAFKWMRIAAGASYRLVLDSQAPALTARQMSAPAGHVSLKFGKF